MRMHSVERPSKCTECGLCLFVLLLLQKAIVVYRAIALRCRQSFRLFVCFVWCMLYCCLLLHRGDGRFLVRHTWVHSCGKPLSCHLCKVCRRHSRRRVAAATAATAAAAAAWCGLAFKSEYGREACWMHFMKSLFSECCLCYGCYR